MYDDKIFDYIRQDDYEQFPYQIDEPWYEIDRKTFILLEAADMMIQYKLSCRGVERELGISKSSIHDFITNGRLEKLSYECYLLCKKQLEWNKRNIQYFVKHKL